MSVTSQRKIQRILKQAVKHAAENREGQVADYIPELAEVNPEFTAGAIHQVEGTITTLGNDTDKEPISLQSVSKLVVLIGLLEEMGPEKVYNWTAVEPSGGAFASIARLDQFGPMPSNPMLNAGAIALCSHIPGRQEAQMAWLEKWMTILFGEKLPMNPKVFASERRTGDRNRSIAYLLKSTGQIKTNVDAVLETYFCMCSFEARIDQCAHLPFLLANGGKSSKGTKVLSPKTVADVISIMATCGLYNETGSHMVRTGLPAKSGVSGLIVAVAPKRGGIAVASPRVNEFGTSVRGEMMLEYISDQCQWHFAM